MSVFENETELPLDSEIPNERLTRRDLNKPVEPPTQIPAQLPAAAPLDQPVRYMSPDEIVSSLNGRPRAAKKVGTLERWQSKRGFLGSAATLLILLIKFLTPILVILAKAKVFLLFAGSMAASIWLESKVFGWDLAVGIVLLIFIHECGHAVAARLRGIPTGIMVFIPFMGAFVTRKGYGRNLEEDAFIGIMGPVVGSIASGITAAFFLIDRNPFWLVLGSWGLYINLFNLLPTPPLDGGWIAPLFSPKLLAIGAVLGVIAGFYNHLIWLLLLVSLPRIIGGWRADPKTQPYYQVAAKARWTYGLIYGGLAGILAISSTLISKFLATAHL